MTEPAPPRPNHGYGTPNTDYVRTWRERADPRPMWALNLMRYRPKAQYPDGRATDLTGWEADDLYAPYEELAAVGASGVLRAPVVHQLVGDGARWDRIGIALYPTQGAMLDMQMSPAFQERHHHKIAGMEFTIVVATFRPEGAPTPPVSADETPLLLLQLVGDRTAPDLAAGLDVQPIATFDADNVIIGDERRYAQARWHAVSEAVGEELSRRPRVEDASSYAFLLRPDRNELAASLQP
ncbi:MAG: hypothetical protein IT546_13690 [Caulobacteraceae bacterium]|nr:hypothetical protein [Caulobacteraceae bacterium]